MSLARKKKGIWKLSLVKDKYNLNCFSFNPSEILELYVLKKEREKLKGFCFIDSKLVNELCYMLQSDDLGIFSSKRKRKKEKKKEKKKDCWETFMFDTACWLNIADILKGKEKRKRNCFLNLIIICLVVAD